MKISREVRTTVLVAIITATIVSTAYAIGKYEEKALAFKRAIQVEEYTTQQLKVKDKEIAVLKNQLFTAQTQLKKTKGQLAKIHKSFVADDSWNVEDATITAYSPLDDQNGINSDGEGEHTSIGMRVGYGRFAVDPARIPYGSDMLIVYPDGSTEQGIAADTGGALRKPGKLKIDVFRMTFKEAMKFGDPESIVLWKAPSK